MSEIRVSRELQISNEASVAKEAECLRLSRTEEMGLDTFCTSVPLVLTQTSVPNLPSLSFPSASSFNLVS